MKLDDIRALAATLPARHIHGEDGTPYLSRYKLHGWMPDAQVDVPCSVYLHQIHRADLDEALHSHPWSWSQTTILAGGYEEEFGELALGKLEQTDRRYRVLLAGDSNEMGADDVHRIRRLVGETWTLFMVGPKRSSWGFYVEGRGMVPWRERLAERGIVPDHPPTERELQLGRRVVKQQILDHGHIELVEHWGSDERIIEAARMSTDKGFQGWGPVRYCPDHPDEVSSASGYVHGGSPLWACPKCGKWSERAGDERLLRYLWENKHATPFEMAGAIIEVQAPIFVFREWHRHRTQSFNELSARYTPMPATDYVPTVERLLVNAGTTNKQAGTVAGSADLDRESANEWLGQLEQLQRHVQEVYDAGLRAGVPKELARLPVTVSRYSRMRASANLRNWLAFLTLRNHAAAQFEIRQYAAALQAILAERFPRTLALFAEGQSK